MNYITDAVEYIGLDEKTSKWCEVIERYKTSIENQYLNLLYHYGIIGLLGKILTNILTALYEPFGFSLLLSFLAMFFYLYAYKPIEAGKGWKNAMVTWYREFKESIFFRKLFFLAFVSLMC